MLELSSKHKGKVIIFFDISEFSKKAGEICIFRNEDLEDPPRNSHKIPVKLYMKLLKKNNNMSYLIGVQPENVDDSLEEPKLSMPIKIAIERIVGNLRRVIIKNNL